MISSCKKNKTPKGAFVFLVAGPGFAPRSAGYEPTEILLLYPAINQRVNSITDTLPNQYLNYSKFLKYVFIQSNHPLGLMQTQHEIYTFMYNLISNFMSFPSIIHCHKITFLNSF